MGKAIAISVAGGVAAALLVLALALVGASGLIVLSLLVPLPLLAVGLSLGLPGAAIAAGTAAVLLVGAVGQISAGLTVLLVYGIPAMLVSRQALLNRPGPRGKPVWYPPGRLVLWLVGYGLAAFLLLLVATAGRPGGFEAVVAEHMSATTAAMPPDMGAAFRDVGTERFARILPGLAVAMWALQMLINIWLAQGLLSQFGGKVRPRFDVAGIEMPGWMAMALAVATAVAATVSGLPGFVAITVALALGYCFFMAGLGVIHAAVRNKPFRPLALTAVYLSLLLSWPALVIAGLGVVDHWAGFRRRALARNPED